MPANPLIIDLSTLILVQVVPLEVTSPKRHFFRQLNMEENNINYTRIPHTPISSLGRGGLVPPPPLPPIRTTANQTPTNYGSGMISTTNMTNIPI
jgi:hypothetical protein